MEKKTLPLVPRNGLFTQKTISPAWRRGFSRKKTLPLAQRKGLLEEKTVPPIWRSGFLAEKILPLLRRNGDPDRKIDLRTRQGGFVPPEFQAGEEKSGRGGGKTLRAIRKTGMSVPVAAG